MRILILANKLPYPPRDGGSIATLNMIKGLRDSGHELTCLALNTSKHNFPVDRIPLELSSSIRFFGVDCNSDIRLEKLLINLLFSRKPYIAERFNSTSYRRKLESILKEEDFDLIQLEGPYLGHYLDTIRQNSKAAVSFRAHNVEHLIWKRKASHETSLLKRWYLNNMTRRLKRFERKLVSRTNCVVAISSEDEAYLKRTCLTGRKNRIKPIITIPTGLQLEDYPASDLPTVPSLFFIGALDWLPNQEGLKWFLEQVYDPLRKELAGLEFHVAGRNAPDHVVRLLDRDQVQYHGEVENAKAFMQSYRVMVAPLLTGSGIRIKILEAMALGRPVVTTGIGIEGIPALSGEQVMIGNDPHVFKNHALNLLKDQELAAGMTKNARKLIRKKFDTFTLSTRLDRFFKEQV